MDYFTYVVTKGAPLTISNMLPSNGARWIISVVIRRRERFGLFQLRSYRRKRFGLFQLCSYRKESLDRFDRSIIKGGILYYLDRIFIERNTLCCLITLPSKRAFWAI